MKKKIFTFLAIITILFSGCSLRSMYIIRNYSDSPVTIELRIPLDAQKNIHNNSYKDLTQQQFQLNMANKIVPLKKNDISNKFNQILNPIESGKDILKYELPANHSLDISKLVGSAGYLDSSSIVLINGKSIKAFSNTKIELNKVFKSKTFSLGPNLFYLDIK